MNGQDTSGFPDLSDAEFLAAVDVSWPTSECRINIYPREAINRLVRIADFPKPFDRVYMPPIRGIRCTDDEFSMLVRFAKKRHAFLTTPKPERVRIIDFPGCCP
jgi:hypothetical protein